MGRTKRTPKPTVIELCESFGMPNRFMERLEFTFPEDIFIYLDQTNDYFVMFLYDTTRDNKSTNIELHTEVQSSIAPFSCYTPGELGFNTSDELIDRLTEIVNFAEIVL